MAISNISTIKMFFWVRHAVALAQMIACLIAVLKSAKFESEPRHVIIEILRLELLCLVYDSNS